MTNNKAKKPSRKVTIKKLGGPPEREKLEKVYRAVLLNFAVGNSDIERITGFESFEVRRLTKNLATKGLLHGEHVNSERTITWQAQYDVQNDRWAERKGMQDFNETYPVADPVTDRAKQLVKSGKRPSEAVMQALAEGGKLGKGGGPRYTVEQIDRAVALRQQGTSWKAIAAEIGVKSPFHFSKVVRANREVG